MAPVRVESRPVSRLLDCADPPDTRTAATAVVTRAVRSMASSARLDGRGPPGIGPSTRCARSGKALRFSARSGQALRLAALAQGRATRFGLAPAGLAYTRL